MKMEAIFYSEASAGFHLTTRRYITEDTTLHSHRCENPECYLTDVLSVTSGMKYADTLDIPSSVHFIRFAQKKAPSIERTVFGSVDEPVKLPPGPEIQGVNCCNCTEQIQNFKLY
jgi:hypothetical protein